MKTKIHKISPSSFVVEAGQMAYSISTGRSYGGDMTIFNAARNPNWEYSYQNVMGKRIVAFGPGNDMPVMVRDLVQDNNLAPGILQRQKGLLYGQGAFLYRHRVKDGRIIREYDDDPGTPNGSSKERWSITSTCKDSSPCTSSNAVSASATVSAANPASHAFNSSRQRTPASNGPRAGNWKM